MDNKLIARVRKMEDDFNMVRDIMDDMESAVYNFEAVQRRIDRLYNYMAEGQFLKDFEADERGELPKDILLYMMIAKEKGYQYFLTLL